MPDQNYIEIEDELYIPAGRVVLCQMKSRVPCIHLPLVRWFNKHAWPLFVARRIVLLSVGCYAFGQRLYDSVGC